MLKPIALTGLVLSVLCSSCLAGDLQELEERIFSVDKLSTMRELLVKLDLLEKWSKEAQKSILLDKQGSLGQNDFTFKAKGYEDIIQVTFSWWFDGDNKPDEFHAFMTRIVFEDKGYYYYYRWKDKQFVQLKTRRIKQPPKQPAKQPAK